MGLFTPKISAVDLAHVKSALKQVGDTTKLVNSTTNPDVYFGRLNFLFDLFLDLKQYEKYKIFKGNSPTSDYNYLMSSLERSVNAFIDRSFEKQLAKIATLKTEKSQNNSMTKYAEKMRAAFNNANNYWSGNIGTPHYTGALFTRNNLIYLNDKLSSFE